MSSSPLFSIIIPTYNEELLLPKTLDSIRSQTFRDYEVIVADDFSSDNTQRIAKEYGVRLISSNRLGEYPSRNAAAQVANGAVLVFTGADAVMPENLLGSVARKFCNNPRLAGVYCPTYPYDGAIWAKVEFTLWYVFTTVLYWITREANASTAFFAVRSEVFRGTDGFLNCAHADSSMSRYLSRRFIVRPQLDLVIFVSGRRTRQGMSGFNRHHLAMIIDVVFAFLRKSHWLRVEKEHRIRLHTRSKQSGTERLKT